MGVKDKTQNKDLNETANNNELEVDSEDKMEKDNDYRADSETEIGEDKEESILKELEEYRDRFLRMAAEYENFRKRTEKEKSLIYNDATCSCISSLLPAIDSLDLAIKSSETSDEGYKKGLAMVRNQVSESFKKLGIESFGEVGESFNPGLHNAVSHIEDDSKDENIISEVFQKGYKKGDRVIRHAMVQVKN